MAWKVIFKTKFDKAELFQMFRLLQKLFYMKVEIQRPILKNVSLKRML